MRIRNLIIIALIWFILPSCTVWNYIDVSKDLSDSGRNFSITVPAGWVQSTSVPALVAITKDGPTLQWVVARSLTYEEFSKDLDVNLEDSTLPSDLSKYYLAKFKKENNLSFIETSYDGLKKIDGISGFEVHINYKNERGLRYKTIAIGFINQGRMYEVLYTAPVLYHFDRYVGEFNNIANSFKRI